MLNVQINSFDLGQIWGNLISYLVLKPKEIGMNGTITNDMRKYDKCGADFSEREYKEVEVINQIDRKTVKEKICFISLFLITRFVFSVLFIYASVFVRF
jgi:hypothetical protein